MYYPTIQRFSNQFTCTCFAFVCFHSIPAILWTTKAECVQSANASGWAWWWQIKFIRHFISMISVSEKDERFFPQNVASAWVLTVLTLNRIKVLFKLCQGTKKYLDIAQFKFRCGEWKIFIQDLQMNWEKCSVLAKSVINLNLTFYRLLPLAICHPLYWPNTICRTIAHFELQLSSNILDFLHWAFWFWIFRSCHPIFRIYLQCKI